MKRHAESNGFRIITVPSPAEELITTCKGTTTYLHWCHAEIDRNNRASRSSRFHLHAVDGKVCVAAR